MMGLCEQSEPCRWYQFSTPVASQYLTAPTYVCQFIYPYQRNLILNLKIPYHFSCFYLNCKWLKMVLVLWNKVDFILPLRELPIVASKHFPKVRLLETQNPKSSWSYGDEGNTTPDSIQSVFGRVIEPKNCALFFKLDFNAGLITDGT